MCQRVTKDAWRDGGDFIGIEIDKNEHRIGEWKHAREDESDLIGR